GVPAEAIDAAVRDITNSEGAAAGDQNHSISQYRGKVLAVAGAAAAVALIIGGVIGGLIGYNNRGTTPAAAPVTVTAQAPVTGLTPTLADKPDPVCAEWAPLLDSYNAKMKTWTKTDPTIPAKRWSTEQRELSLSIIPELQAEAADMRRLADKAEDPYLASLLRGQAMYEAEYAERIPNYDPSDHRLWRAVISFSGAVKALCSAQ
ncbi:MAG: hypothetical protein K0U78_11450, partial [Actinomycetia bacterium]|nr:hypothetical protein [Actinomycetes bacterium]